MKVKGGEWQETGDGVDRSSRRMPTRCAKCGGNRRKTTQSGGQTQKKRRRIRQETKKKQKKSERSSHWTRTMVGKCACATRRKRTEIKTARHRRLSEIDRAGDGGIRYSSPAAALGRYRRQRGETMASVAGVVFRLSADRWIVLSAAAAAASGEDPAPNGFSSL